MDPLQCSFCIQTNHIPEGQLVIVAAFAEKFQAENALWAVEKAHMQPAWWYIFSQKEILGEKFSDCKTLVVVLHGIKDIIKLQSLYIESMCHTNKSLTVDILSTKQSCEAFLQKLQN